MWVSSVSHFVRILDISFASLIITNHKLPIHTEIATIRACPFAFSHGFSLAKFSFERPQKAVLQGKTCFAAYSRNLQNCTGSQPELACCSAKCSCLAAYKREMTSAPVANVSKQLLCLLDGSYSRSPCHSEFKSLPAANALCGS